MTRGLGAIDSPAAADPAGFYAHGYTAADPAEGERLGRWRALGARGKAAHVEALLAGAGLHPRAVVEIGCGDGALLAALAARGVGEALDGFELSEEAAALARGRAVPGVRRVAAYDGAHIPAADGAYDLAVLSHVIEHVPDPVALLREAGRVAAHVAVEVPLEANRSAARPGKRAEAARIGHLHALDRGAIRALCADAGLTVLAELTDPSAARAPCRSSPRRRATGRRPPPRRRCGAGCSARPRGARRHCSRCTTRAWRGPLRGRVALLERLALRPRAPRAPLDAASAHDRHEAHVEHGPRGVGVRLPHADVVAAHEGDLGHLDVQVVGHAHVGAAHDRDDAQLGSLGGAAPPR